MTSSGVPPGHRVGRSVLLGTVLLAVAGTVVLVVAGGAAGWVVDTGAAIVSWAWDFPWIG